MTTEQDQSRRGWPRLSPLLALTSALLLALAALLLAFWSGEKGGLVPGLAELVALGLSVPLLALLLPGHWLKKLVAAGLAVLLMLAAYVAGYASYQHAFEDCAQGGEALRPVLTRFHAEQGRYPASLAELGVAAPGQRWLHGPLMHYQRVGSGYVLQYRDWLISYSASDSGSFDAHK